MKSQIEVGLKLLVCNYAFTIKATWISCSAFSFVAGKGKMHGERCC